MGSEFLGGCRWKGEGTAKKKKERIDEKDEGGKEGVQGGRGNRGYVRKMKTNALKTVQDVSVSRVNRHQKMMMAALAQNTTRKVVAIYCPNDCVECMS